MSKLINTIFLILAILAVAPSVYFGFAQGATGAAGFLEGCKGAIQCMPQIWEHNSGGVLLYTILSGLSSLMIVAFTYEIFRRKL